MTREEALKQLEWNAMSVIQHELDKEVVHSIFNNIGSCGECKFSKNSRNVNIVRCSILDEQIKKATGFCDEFEREIDD